MVYNLYNLKLKTSGASILHTPRSRHENELMKSGDGQGFNVQLEAVNDEVTIIGCTFDADDYFTGSNGDFPDSARWTRWVAVDGLCEIQNNRLRMYSNTYGGLARCTNNAKFDDDFSISIDFILISAGGSIPIYWYIDLFNNSNNYRVRFNNGNDPTQAYDDYIYIQQYNGSWTSPYKNHTIWWEGEIKFIRTGNSLAVWAKNVTAGETELTLRDTMGSFGPGKVTWKFEFPNTSNSNINTWSFDNFTLNAGTMDCT